MTDDDVATHIFIGFQISSILSSTSACVCLCVWELALVLIARLARTDRNIATANLETSHHIYCLFRLMLACSFSPPTKLTFFHFLKLTLLRVCPIYTQNVFRSRLSQAIHRRRLGLG